MCFLFELFFLVDFLHEVALSLPNSCHFYSLKIIYFAQVHCEKIQGFNRKNAFWCYFHFEWVLKLSKLSISCSVMCQKVKESDFHFPTILLGTYSYYTPRDSLGINKLQLQVACKAKEEALGATGINECTLCWWQHYSTL